MGNPSRIHPVKTIAYEHYPTDNQKTRVTFTKFHNHKAGRIQCRISTTFLSEKR
jgi:hypothetical protein